MPKEIIYELAYLISGDLDEAKAHETAKKIEEMLSGLGQIKLSLEPKKIKLAYSIKKKQEGFLVSVDFTTKPANIAVISKTMEKEADVLRFLTIKKTPERPKEERPGAKKIEEEKAPEEKIIVKTEAPKKEKPIDKETKEEDLKKIEQDLDEILGQ